MRRARRPPEAEVRSSSAFRDGAATTDGDPTGRPVPIRLAALRPIRPPASTPDPLARLVTAGPGAHVGAAPGPAVRLRAGGGRAPRDPRHSRGPAARPGGGALAVPGQRRARGRPRPGALAVPGQRRARRPGARAPANFGGVETMHPGCCYGGHPPLRVWVPSGGLFVGAGPTVIAEEICALAVAFVALPVRVPPRCRRDLCHRGQRSTSSTTLSVADALGRSARHVLRCELRPQWPVTQIDYTPGKDNKISHTHGVTSCRAAANHLGSARNDGRSKAPRRGQRTHPVRDVDRRVGVSRYSRLVRRCRPAASCRMHRRNWPRNDAIKNSVALARNTPSGTRSGSFPKPMVVLRRNG